MDLCDESKILRIVELRKKAHSFYKAKSKVYRAFLEMERNTYTEGALSKKQKELIAIGISIVQNCESCMEWHISQALSDGAKEDEILEAIDVGIEMSGGPGTVASRFAMNVLEHYRDSGVHKQGLSSSRENDIMEGNDIRP
jgi:AhpD family alkylhydroperoxidase